MTSSLIYIIIIVVLALILYLHYRPTIDIVDSLYDTKILLWYNHISEDNSNLYVRNYIILFNKKKK